MPFVITPSKIPPNHSQYITVNLVLSGGAMDGTTVIGISGVLNAVKVDQTITDAENAIVRIYTGDGVGTLTFTESVTGSATGTLTVAGYMPNPLFPTGCIWQEDISAAPLHTLNAFWLTEGNGVDLPYGWRSHASHNVHEDFGSAEYSGVTVGIPINVVDGSTFTWAAITITAYASQSDAIPGGTLPIPDWVVIESDTITAAHAENADADQHCLILDTNTGILHEFYHLTRVGDGTYTARQYSKWDTASLTLRTNGWTSTDAAGLPVAPLLVDYDEVQAAIDSNGDCGHAFRFTMDLSSSSFFWPARHYAGSGASYNPPMGMRVRMKASVDLSSYSPEVQAIGRTLKKYGMIMADNGGEWFIQGKPDLRWDDTHCQQLRNFYGNTHFEVVDTSNWQVGPDSSEANPANPVRDIQIKDEIDIGVTYSGNFLSHLGIDDGYSATAHNSLRDRAYPDGSGNTWTKYNFTGLTSGKTYRIAAMWPASGPSAATNAPWFIYGSDGTTELASDTLDLTQAPSDFTDTQTGFTGDYLADVVCDGDNITIELNGNANSYVIADAIWVEGANENITIVCSLPTG